MSNSFLRYKLLCTFAQPSVSKQHADQDSAYQWLLFYIYLFNLQTEYANQMLKDISKDKKKKKKEKDKKFN